MTCAMSLIKVKKGCASPTSLSRPQPSIDPVARQMSGRLEMETNAVDDQGVQSYNLLNLYMAHINYLLIWFLIYYIIYTMFYFFLCSKQLDTMGGRRFRQQDVCWYNGEGLSNTPHLYQVHVHIELMATFI